VFVRLFIPLSQQNFVSTIASFTARDADMKPGRCVVGNKMQFKRCAVRVLIEYLHTCGVADGMISIADGF